jgi:hypothetical protein
LVARALAQQIELALERVAVVARGRGDEQLLDLRSGVARAVTQVGGVGVRRNDAPPDQRLAFLGADRGDDGLAALALACIGRQEHDAGRKLAGRRQRSAERLLRDLSEKLVRQRREHAGAVARVGLGTARAAMIHAAQEVIGVLDDLVAALAFDVRNEADAAAVVLELGAIQPLCRREAGALWFTHACRPHAARAFTTHAPRARLGAPRGCSFVCVALAVMVLTAVSRLAPPNRVFCCRQAVFAMLTCQAAGHSICRGAALNSRT